jgi:hypothetical protein
LTDISRPEGRTSKWSLLAGYNPDQGYIEEVYMEDATKSINVANYVWDTTTLAWVKSVQNSLITDSVYLAVDDVEALLTTIDADTSAMALSLAIMDDWDESNRAKVNPIVGQAGVAAGAGAVGVTVQSVTLASDDPLLVETQDAQIDYKLADWDASGDPIYVGKTDKAENWFITEYNIASGTARYIKGSGSYSTNWTNRAGLSYDPFYTEF